MPKSTNPIVSGSGTAVLLGFFAIIAAVFLPDIAAGERAILFFLGALFAWLGLRFSRG